MRDAPVRQDPVITFGSPPDPAPVVRRIERAPRHAPTGALTRSILRKQSSGDFDHLRRSLDLSDSAFDVISEALLATREAPLSDEGIADALRSLFVCEPVTPTTSQPIILVGSSHSVRHRAALSLSQRLEWAGRRVALYSLQMQRFPVPIAMQSGGLDVLAIGSVEACLDAVKAREPGELAIVDASCLEGGTTEAAGTLSMLTHGLNAEPVYVDDGVSDLPDFSDLATIRRVILAGSPRPARFGAILEAALQHDLAFAGRCTSAWLYHPMTTALLADRFAVSIR